MTGFLGKLSISGGLNLRLAATRDRDFLFALLQSARPFLALGTDDKDYLQLIYENQFHVMTQGQGHVYPKHLDFVIEKWGESVGRVVLNFGYVDWRISEIAVIPALRRSGIGRHVIGSIQNAAMVQHKPITLAVNKTDERAKAFYARMGFGIIDETPLQYQLIWLPPGHPILQPVYKQM
jgi:ribosomal protein S18 acetylase RimI-like enzyme